MIFNSTSHTYLSSLMRFFVRKGKKQKIQSKIYTFIRIKNKDQKSKLRRMLKTCCIKTSTYLRLIQRRRGRRIQYKIKFLKRSFGRKRGLLLVGKSMYWHTKKSPRQFTFLFNQELNNWAHGKHSLKQKYKETHIIAKRYAPRSWFWKVKIMKKIKKTIKPNEQRSFFLTIHKVRIKNFQNLKLKKKQILKKLNFLCNSSPDSEGHPAIWYTSEDYIKYTKKGSSIFVDESNYAGEQQVEQSKPGYWGKQYAQIKILTCAFLLILSLLILFVFVLL